jgi:hypothetical protein
MSSALAVIDWIKWVLLEDGLLTRADATHDLNKWFSDKATVGEELIMMAQSYISDAKNVLQMLQLLQRLLTVLDASHTAYALDNTRSNLLTAWVYWLFDWLNTRHIENDEKLHAAIHDITQWLLTHGNFDPAAFPGYRAHTCIYRFTQAMQNNRSRLLKKRMGWQTLALLAPHFWPDIDADICDMFLNFHQPVSSDVLIHVWWFLKECITRAPTHVYTWRKSCLYSLLASNKWCVHLEQHLCLAAYLVYSGATSSLSTAKLPSPVLHLLVASTRDPVLANILGLSDVVCDSVRPIVTNWLAHTWMHEGVNDGHALLRIPTNDASRIHACGVHLWHTWRLASQHALDVHLIPDLARLALSYLEA